MNVAVVGLGQMGAGMAANLVAAGHSVTVWNRNPAKVKPLLERGAVLAGSIAEAAAVGTVFTMLANDEAVEDVVCGQDGVLAAGPGVLHISSSTISTVLTERLTAAHAAAGQRLISAPVLGRPDVATAGKLSIFAAGAAEDIQAAQPLLDAIGTATLPIGDKPVMAAAMKIAANAGIPAIIEMLTEQMRIARLYDIPESKLVDVLLSVDYGNRLVRSYGPILAEKRFEPADFPMVLGRKDIGLALGAAERQHLPLIQMIADRMDRIIAIGKGDRDWATLGQPLDDN